MNQNRNNNFYTKGIVVWLGALICCFLWGSAFPVIKIGYILLGINSNDFAEQILFAGIRFLLAGILAVILGSIFAHKVIYPEKSSWLQIGKLSFFQTIAQYGFFYIGLALTTGVRASIVEGTNVFVAILVASLLFRQEKLTMKKIIGCGVGFAGVVLVNFSGVSAGGGNFFLGDSLVFLSTVCYAFSSVLLKEYSKKEDPVVLSGYQFIIGGIVMIIVGFFMGGRIDFSFDKGLLVLVYLAFVSAVAYSLWGILMKYNPISRVAVFGFMNPVFGVILSAVLLDEGSGLGLLHMVSLGLVCAGIYIVNKVGEEGEK